MSKPQALENENTRLKQLLAEAMPGNAMLKDLNAKEKCLSQPGGKP